MPHLFVFGYGYSARYLGRARAQASDDTWRITGTRRSVDGVSELRTLGVEGVRFDGAGLDAEAREALGTATHVLVSIAPDTDGDPVLRHASEALRECPELEWVGYLSTTGVYGDHAGDWVDESTPPSPAFPRTERRLAAERAWTDLCADIGVPIQIYRLTGIYGPGRSVVEKLRQGTARRIVESGHVSNRIHVEDIASAIEAGIRRPHRAGIFNVTDDLPSPPEDPLLFAAEAMGMTPPPPVSLDEAGLGPMGRSFYAQSRRVRNERARSELGWSPRYPTYREGLTAILHGQD
jgi:nucleoside-diphosphate-sugar epimerase